MNDQFIKGILVGIMLLYIISPIDAFPGPIDDIVVAIAGLVMQKSLG